MSGLASFQTGWKSISLVVGSEEARVKRWPPSAAQTARTVFPYAAFTKTQRRQDAREGIK